MNNYSSVSKGFQPKFTLKLIQSSSNSNNQADQKFQKDYKAEYKKLKAKLALLEASPSSSQNPKTFRLKNKVLFAETFYWDEEEVSDEEEVTQVKELMALADDELTVGKSHAHNGEWVDITMRKVNTLLSMDEDADWQNYLKYINIDLKFIEEQQLNLLSKYNKMVFELNKCKDELLILKQTKLDVVTFQIQNTELIKLNYSLQEQLKEEKKINKKWLTSSKKASQCISEQIPHQKKKVLGGELLTESSSKKNENEYLFVPASMGYDQEMVPKTKDWVERLNPDSKLPNFNTGRVLVPESQPVNESFETSNTPESSKDFEAEFLTPLPPLKILQGASPSLEVLPLTFQPHSPKERPGLVPTEVKDTKQESKLNELTKLVQMLIDEKVNFDQKTQESNSNIQKAEPKPIQKLQLKCELCHYTNHSTDDCYRILYCMICKREDHRTLDHEMYIASLKRSENYKAQPYQYASSSKQILRAKAKPFPPCKHCGFNDHIPDDCRNYPECGIYESYDHSTSGHNHVIQIRGGVLAESSQSNESSIRVKCNTCGSIVYSTSDHNEFDHFKRGEKIQAAKARDPTKNGCSRIMTGVKSYLHKYVEQPGPKVVYGDNSSCITEGYDSINCGGIVFTKVAFVNGLKYNLISISQLCDAKYIVQFDDKQGIIFNANKEIVLIAPRRNDVYVLDMSSLTPNEACFFAKASESVNWLWHNRLSHLNFKNINKLAKQNKVLDLPSLELLCISASYALELPATVPAII
ncbi:retrovirus-related pol polyprotein from transposon TNT 1-94, partial [Tanacetum coccineum]